jgi:haloacetate dehalogenase
MSGFEDFS